jgi:uncharacterized protein YfaP (DUF2135 family)
MSWGTLPLDLDLHMAVFNASNVNQSCHIFYNHKICDGATLDVDNTNVCLLSMSFMIKQH